MKLGDQIKKYRTEKGNLTQAEFAQLVTFISRGKRGISTRYVSSIESGAEPSREVRQKAENALRVQDPRPHLEQAKKDQMKKITSQIPNDFDVTIILNELANSGQDVTFGDFLQIVRFKYAYQDEIDDLPERLRQFVF